MPNSIALMTYLLFILKLNLKQEGNVKDGSRKSLKCLTNLSLLPKQQPFSSYVVSYL